VLAAAGKTLYPEGPDTTPLRPSNMGGRPVALRLRIRGAFLELTANCSGAQTAGAFSVDLRRRTGLGGTIGEREKMGGPGDRA